MGMDIFVRNNHLTRLNDMRINHFRHFFLALALLACSVGAQPLPSVQGTTFQGKPFNLASLKGKVVLLMFWSTDCAVCRDKMPELRLNYEAGKPNPSSWCW